MPRSARRRLRTGIYEDRSGRCARVNVKGQSREKRFPFDAPLSELDTWREQTTRLLNLVPSLPSRGTLGHDALTYYKAVGHLASFMARRAEIRAWILKLGEKRRRASVNVLDVRNVRGEWLKEKVAPKTINNRVFALAHLYRTLDGEQYPTPCDGVDPLPVTRQPPVRVTDTIIRTIAANMAEKERKGILKDGKTRARFLVFASTGRRPSEIGRAKPEDVDIPRRVWLPRDGKGGYSPGVYLNDDMRAAWQLFIAEDAFGEFDSGSFARRIRSSGFPAHVKPYQLRHTIGIAMSEAGVDLRDIGEHLGHKRLETTKRHYVPVLNSRLQKASESLDARKLGWTSDTVPRARATRTPRKPSDS